MFTRRIGFALCIFCFGAAAVLVAPASGAASPPEAQVRDFEMSFRELPSDDRAALAARISVPDAVIPSNEMVSSQIRLRGSLEMNVDRAFVSKLFEDPERAGAVVSSGGDFAGLRVTIPEAEAMALRNLLQFSMSRVLEALHPGSFDIVEVKISKVNGVDLATVLVDSPPSTEFWDNLVSMVPTPIADRVVWAQSKVRSSDLDKVSETISKFVIEKGLIAGVFPRYFDGKVVVSSPSAEVGTALSGVGFDDLIEFETADRESGSTANNKNEAMPFGVVYSSLLIEYSGTGCSSGFSTSSAYGQVLLTAGHCFPLGVSATQAGVSVGPVVARNWPMTSAALPQFDAEAINSSVVGRPLLGRMHINSADFAHRVTGWIGQNADVLGSIGCQSGWASSGLDGYSGPNCGVLLDRNFDPYWLTTASASYRRFDTLSTPGDSGGGVIWDSIYGSLAIALVQGRYVVSGNIDLIASHLPYVLDSWGLTPLTN